MINILKFDFFKIRKSITLRIIFIFSLVCCLMNPFVSFLKGNSFTASWNLYFIVAVQYEVIIPIFVIFFVGMDFSSKYIKNFYASTSKLMYVLSKLIYVVAYVLALMILDMFCEVFFTMGMMGRPFYKVDAPYSLEEFFTVYFIKWGINLSLALLITALVFLVRSRVIALVVFFVYYFLVSTYLYMLINTIVGNGFEVSMYTIFGNINGRNFGSREKDTLIYGLDILCYSVVAIVTAILGNFRKKV